MPLRQDDLSYPDFEDQLHSGTVPQISATHVRFSQVDDHDDDNLPSPSAALSHSRLKGKQPESECRPDVMSDVPPYDHQRFESGSSPTKIEQEHTHVAGTSRIPWKYTDPTTVAANDDPDALVAPRSAVISSDDSFMLQSLDHSFLNGDDSSDQQLSSLPFSHCIERSPPLLWAPLSLTVSHIPPPSRDSQITHLQYLDGEPTAHHDFTPQLDYTSDSSSDTSVSTTSTPYEWTDSEPSSPVGALVVPQDDPHTFPTVHDSVLFNLSSDADIDAAGESLLESMHPPYKAREVITDHHKLKRLFLMEEDDVYGERARKQRCVER